MKSALLPPVATAEDGTFSIAGLNPGSYMLTASGDHHSGTGCSSAQIRRLDELLNSPGQYNSHPVLCVYKIYLARPFILSLARSKGRNDASDELPHRGWHRIVR